MAIDEQRASINDTEEQLVVFTLANESFGVGIESVSTIIRLPEITRVPRSPDFIDGVINLRGAIIPIIDLRKRFGLPTAEATKATRIIVIDNGKLIVGLVVDAVTETLRIPLSCINMLSPLVVSVDSQYLRGVGQVDDRLVILLSLDRILAADEENSLKELVNTTN
ncbi:MAG TPA: chemotaxis protein CheW [Armatimonadota bacterium]|nr:chemotaxis protein CheW [Armatimonadota bacterium]